MEYGILVVEDGQMYQIIGRVYSVKEALDAVKDYEAECGPDNPDVSVPPTTFVMVRRNSYGYYTMRETLKTSGN